MNEDIQYLFDSRGAWIAFRRGKYVFDPSGGWMGWLPWDDKDVVDKSGNYLGTIYAENRLYSFRFHPYRGYPGYPAYPSYPGYPGYPGYAGYSPLPVGAQDVDLSKAG